MLKKDKTALARLVEEYDLTEVISVLVQVARERADQLSDLGLKEKAQASIEISELLCDIRDVMEDD